jgi:xanthine dehydrogenase molybdopterin binding subunit/xanthine dehydrogenase small subunit
MSSAPHLTINGKVMDVGRADLHQSLLDFLRRSRLTGTKMGCNEGDCGACTILVLEKEGPPRAINSCLALVGSLVGREILTSEGLVSEDGKLHPVQQEMVAGNGSQCGYCTPGFICSMAEAAARGVQNDPAAVADQLCGNLCRCTGYRPIREAMAQSPTTLISNCTAAESPSLPGYHRPTSIEAALAFKAQFPDAPFIAGATELAVLINKRHTRYSALISLDEVAELKLITASESHWHLGAAAPLTDIEEALAGEYPAMDAMLRRFASRQIRHRATLGGNLVTASPIGDAAPVLLALDAELEFRSVDARRVVPVSEFFIGYRETVLRDDEILSAVLLPRGLAGKMEFFKVSKRREMDISTVSAAIRIAHDENGVITAARLAYGGVAATPARALKVEAALLGGNIGDASSDELLALLAEEFTPLDDLRGSAKYREALIVDLYLKYLVGDSDVIEPPVTSDFQDEGTNSQAHESAIGHVTGRASYVDDIALLGGGLAVWPVRSAHAHAKFQMGDLTAARNAPGVRAILTAEDIPGINNTGPARTDEPLFAFDEIHFHGQLIAAVVADDPESARLAAGLIPITYEALTPLLGIEAAVEAVSFHTEPHILTRGDVGTALADSPYRLSGTLHLGGQEHFYLETHAALATPDGEGGVFVQSSTQHPSEVQAIVAEILHLEKNQVVVECPRMGGGFGGKETQGNAWAAVVALAAIKTGRTVAVQLDRDVDIESTGKRHPFFARFNIGYQPDGRLHAADVQLYSDGGWALDLSQPVNDRGLFHLDNAYYIPHVHFSGRVCKTNVCSHTAFRGFGGPQGMVVIEDILARIADQLGIAPEVVRERNFYHGEGETNTTHYGEKVEDNRLQRIWTELLETSDFVERKSALVAWNASHPNRKRGLAITPVKFGISFTLKHYNQAGALVHIYTDGSVQVNHGGTEMGQGLHTKILAVAMSELGLPTERIRLMRTRTDKVPNTSATAASSGSDLNGMAVADACRQIRERLAPLASELLDCRADELIYVDAKVATPKGKSMPFAELIVRAYTERIQLSAAGFYATPDLQWDWSVGKGKPFHYFAFGAAVSEVEVDGYTGMQHLRRVDILHDVGDSLNPAIDRGQIEGGFVQGAGWLTCEELKWNDEGRLLTHSASTYAIPAISDAPLEFRVALLKDARQARTIHGSKAVGEPPLMLAISVREALRDALRAFGCDVQSLESPLTPEALKLAKSL